MTTIPILILTGAMLLGGGTTTLAAPGAEIARFEQLAQRPPADIEDGLFILWEYGGALRERELAEVVLRKTQDLDVRKLAEIVRDGHQAGMDAMRQPAAELGMELPTEPTALEQAAIRAADQLPAPRLDAYFIRRQRSMHAWDITTFDDYRTATGNPRLRAYVDAVRKPLREHSALVDQIARKKGLLRTGAD